MKYLVVALLLTGCGLINDIEESLLGPPPEPKAIELDFTTVPTDSAVKAK